MGLKRTVANWLAGDLIENEVARRVELAEDRIHEDPFAYGMTQPSGVDLDWQTRREFLDNALNAWRINPYARRVVNITTAYLVGRGITINCGHDDVNAWIRAWWFHRKNNFPMLIHDLTDELTRAGEWFFLLFTNPQNGMQFVRPIPARWVEQIESNPDDYMDPRKYLVNTGQPEPEWFPHVNHAEPDQPAMVHYAVNRPIGAKRSWGGDLDPMLPSLRRYVRWQKAQVRQSEAMANWAWKMIGANAQRVEELERKYKGARIPAGGIWFGTADEDLQAVAPSMQGGDAETGQMLRQGIATGGNAAPWMLGDTQATTHAIAEASAGTSFRSWEVRQTNITAFLYDLTKTAVTRAFRTRLWHRRYNRNLPGEADWQLSHTTVDLTPRDNEALANAAHTIVDACAVMKGMGWIDDLTAIEWAIRFAGESIDPQVILDRLEKEISAEEIAEREVAARRTPMRVGRSPRGDNGR